MSSRSFGQRLLTLLAQRKRTVLSSNGTYPPRRILVIRLNRLGDLICALPLYRTLQLNWPEARIDWLLGRQNAVLAPFIRVRGEVSVLNESFCRYWIPNHLLRDLQSRQYQLSVAVKGGYDSRLAWLSLAAAAPERIGFLENQKERFNFAYTGPVPKPDPHQHQVEKGLKLIEHFHFPQRSDDISLDVPAAAKQKVQAELAVWGIGNSQPFAVLQLSSTKRPFMRWPREHYVALGRMFLDRKVPVCVNATSDEQLVAEELARALGQGARAACFKEMAEYLGFLAAAKVVIGSDGGGIHLASAVGTHTAAFYAESHPVKWRPWQGEHIQFYTANRDVREVTPAQVWEKICESGWMVMP